MGTLGVIFYQVLTETFWPSGSLAPFIDRYTYL